MMLVQQHESDHLFKRAVESFERFYPEREHRAKFMAIAIHPHISGQPFRIGPLERIYEHIGKFDGVLHWNGEQMLDWYAKTANVKFGNA